MTLENQRIRDCLKAAESVITHALVSQPDDDTECGKHLVRACMDVVAIAKKGCEG